LTEKGTIPIGTLTERNFDEVHVLVPSFKVPSSMRVHSLIKVQDKNYDQYQDTNFSQRRNFDREEP
jgi:hypothetical protein